ncbi:hypothetical protein AAHA92_25139 [Salvia divinorum]|uniref:Uncharacterized protein n=1 Tax=Salvia divinorum TaxID=28513 RepID=A0ABD1G9Q4_SALDI
MVSFTTKHLLLMAFFLFCFISTSIQEKLNISQSPNLESMKGNDDIARDEVLQDNEELAIIDYTPVKKKAPIHN